MSTFHKALRAFAVDLINQPGDHKRQEIADAFLDAHPELAKDYMRELAVKQVAAQIKDLCDASDADPLPLFSGFPAAITVGPGVVKATRHCVLDDLGAGMEYRLENLRNARARAKAYGEAMTAFEGLRATEVETVGECADRLRKQGPATS